MNKMIVQINQEPLVSVAVTTFNNAKVIVETLESIYSQTYQNIELIVSDDASTITLLRASTREGSPNGSGSLA